MLKVVVNWDFLLERLSIPSSLFLISIQSIQLVIKCLLSFIMHSQNLHSFSLELFHVNSSQFFGFIISNLFKSLSFSLNVGQDLILDEPISFDSTLNDSHIWEALLVESFDEFSNITWILPLLLVVVGSYVETQISNDNTWCSSA